MTQIYDTTNSLSTILLYISRADEIGNRQASHILVDPPGIPEFLRSAFPKKKGRVSHTALLFGVGYARPIYLPAVPRSSDETARQFAFRIGAFRCVIPPLATSFFYSPHTAPTIANQETHYSRALDSQAIGYSHFFFWRHGG